MKSKAWQKMWVVVMHSEYDDTWTEKTIPCTEMQAIRFIRAKRWGHALDTGAVRIVSLDQLKTLNESKHATF